MSEHPIIEATSRAYGMPAAEFQQPMRVVGGKRVIRPFPATLRADARQAAYWGLRESGVQIVKASRMLGLRPSGVTYPGVSGCKSPNARRRGVDQAPPQEVIDWILATAAGESPERPGPLRGPFVSMLDVTRSAVELGVPQAALMPGRATAVRCQRESAARALVCVVLRRVTVASWPEIAFATGMRSHTAAMYAASRAVNQTDSGEFMQIARAARGRAASRLAEGVVA